MAFAPARREPHCRTSTMRLLPDGRSVPMWGGTFCGRRPSTSLALHAQPQKPDDPAVGRRCWQPAVDHRPHGQQLLDDQLSRTLASSGAVPTSLVIVGQLGGGSCDTAESEDFSPSSKPSSAIAHLASFAGAPAIRRIRRRSRGSCAVVLHRSRRRVRTERSDLSVGQLFDPART